MSASIDICLIPIADTHSIVSAYDYPTQAGLYDDAVQTLIMLDPYPL